MTPRQMHEQLISLLIESLADKAQGSEILAGEAMAELCRESYSTLSSREEELASVL